MKYLQALVLKGSCLRLRVLLVIALSLVCAPSLCRSQSAVRAIELESDVRGYSIGEKVYVLLESGAFLILDTSGVHKTPLHVDEIDYDDLVVLADASTLITSKGASDSDPPIMDVVRSWFSDASHIELWDIHSGKRILRHGCDLGFVDLNGAVLDSQSGLFAYSGTRRVNHTVRVIDLQSGTTLRKIEVPDFVNQLAFEDSLLYVMISSGVGVIDLRSDSDKLEWIVQWGESGVSELRTYAVFEDGTKRIVAFDDAIDTSIGPVTVIKDVWVTDKMDELTPVQWESGTDFIYHHSSQEWCLTRRAEEWIVLDIADRQIREYQAMDVVGPGRLGLLMPLDGEWYATVPGTWEKLEKELLIFKLKQ